MIHPNIFSPEVATTIITRINKLTPATKPLWGTMRVEQVLAHMNVTYELAFEDKHKKPPLLVKLMLKAFVKPAVVGAKPYAQNGRTAPAFIIADERNFNLEKDRLVNYINQTVGLGKAHFEGKESHSFGKLHAAEWNTMFYKHLDHHLNQFGV